jgi:hypothetical protein
MKRTDSQSLQKLVRIADCNQKVPPSLRLGCLVAVVVVAVFSSCSHRAAARLATATIDSSGTTTFRDDRGRTIGTATTPRQW